MKKKATTTKKPAVKKTAPKKKAVVKKKPVVKKAVKKGPGRSTTPRKGLLGARARESKAVYSRPIARVSHYFDKIKVAAFKLKAPLKKGDVIYIEGGDRIVKQKISSMQIEHKTVSSAKAKDEVGIKVSKKVREGYRVYKLPRPPA